MKSVSRMLVCLVALLLVSPSFGQDEPAKKGNKAGKGKAASAAMMEKLAAVQLTEEQKPKLAELAKEFDTTMATLKEAGLTQELMKKKADAMKQAREEGKKGKNVEADVVASLNLTTEQQDALKKATAAQTKFQKGIATTLTAEQIATLPEAVQQQLGRAKEPGKKGKAKAE